MIINSPNSSKALSRYFPLSIESVRSTSPFKAGSVAFHLNTVLKGDPTRTSTLRNKFIAEMEKRFNNIKNVVRYSIVDNDCFGLNKTWNKNPLQVFAKITPAGYAQFDFPRDKKKVDSFMSWLKQQESREDGPLEIITRPGTLTGIESPWTDTYVYTAYQRGVRRAREELHKLNPNIPKLENTAEIRAVMSGPMHINTAGVLFTRAFEGLKGITAEMDKQISEIITQGIINGENPLLIADQLLNGVANELGFRAAGPYTKAIQRARALARTEVVRAHHLANIADRCISFS